MQGEKKVNHKRYFFRSFKKTLFNYACATGTCNGSYYQIYMSLYESTKLTSLVDACRIGEKVQSGPYPAL